MKILVVFRMTGSALLLSCSPAVAIAGSTDVGVFEPGIVVTDIFPKSGIENVAQDLVDVSKAGTAYVTESVAEIYALCAKLPQKEYTVDCLGERLAALAATLPDKGDYVEAKKVLDETAQKLRSVAQRNRSTSKPTARVRTTVNKTPVLTAPLTPVKPEAVEASIAEAITILDEAQTKLLRSGANSDRRKVHYQAMAKAVGSNKILLRAT